MPRITSARYIAELKSLGYEFRMNDMTEVVEVNGQPLTDSVAAEMRSRMRDRDFGQTRIMEDAILMHAGRNRYHPIREYLDELRTKYPNPAGAIARLAGFFHDTHGVFCSFFRRWLIGAVAKAYDAPGAQNFMLVLDGPQDIGKSYFANWICPLPDYFIEGAVSTDDKDTWLRLCSKLVWEVGELGAVIRKADRDALKDFITRNRVTLRRPYGKYDITKPALASLIGTINETGAGFLNDPTGNRRFAVVNLTQINWAYAQELDLVNRVWAEAVHLFDQKEPWRLAPDEKALQNNINEEYHAVSLAEELFLECYEIDPSAQTWVPVTDIMRTLTNAGLSPTQQGRALIDIAGLLHKYGVKKGRPRLGGNPVAGYLGIRLRKGLIP